MVIMCVSFDVNQGWPRQKSDSDNIETATLWKSVVSSDWLALMTFGTFQISQGFQLIIRLGHKIL